MVNSEITPISDQQFVLADDNQTSFWSTNYWGQGSISPPVLTDDSSVKVSGDDCLRISVSSGNYSRWIIYKDWKENQNWLNFSYITFSWAGQNTGNWIVLTIFAPNETSKFTYEFLDDFSTWRTFTVSLIDFRCDNNADWSKISHIELTSNKDNSFGTFRVDNFNLIKTYQTSFNYENNENELLLLALLSCFLAPLTLLFSGYSLYYLFIGRHSTRAVLEKLFLSLLFGSVVIIVPALLWIVLVDFYLNLFYIGLTIVLAALSAIIVKLYYKKMALDLRDDLNSAKNFFKGSYLHKFCLIAFLIFTVKTVYTLLLNVINVDALFLYLPQALHYFLAGGAGISTDPPGAVILFSWSYTFSPTTFEPFRLIPMLFILSIPLIIYSLSKKYLSTDQALVAFGLSCFAPFLDFGISGPTNWIWHSDFIALFFFGLSLFLYLNNSKSDNFLAGLSLSLSILTKPAFGLAAAIMILSIYLIQNRRKLTSSFLFIGVALLLVVYSWEGHFSKLAYISNTFYALLGGIILVLVLLISFNRQKNVEPSTSSSGRLWGIIICQFLPLIWIIRQVALGGAPLALPLFPVQNSSVEWWSAFANSIRQTASQSALNLDVLGIIFYHPLFDIYLLFFALVGCALLFKKRHIFLFLFIEFFFIYVMIMGGLAGIRQLLPLIIFSYPIIGVGLTSIVKRTLGWINRNVLVGLLLIYSFLAVIQQPIFYFFYDNLALSNPPSILGVWNVLRMQGPPYLDYFDPLSIGNFPNIIIISLALFSLISIILLFYRKISKIQRDLI